MFFSKTCIFQFGSWSYHSKEISYKFTDSSNLGFFLDHQEWKVLNFTPRKYQKCFDTINECYSYIDYEMIIQRKPLYYLVNMIAPALLITELCSLGLFSRSNSNGERSEKITLGLTAILSLSVFLLMISDIMPRSSLVVPLFGK